MSENREIDYLLEEVVTLPSLPATVARITQMLESPDCSLSEVGKAIATDPAIALKTLRLVNSAYYGLREKVTSVEHAVTLLGIKVVKNLVFTATVFDTLKSSGNFLRHSIACGMAMRTLAERHPRPLPIESPDEAFIFGLLHDIGKIIFEQFLSEEYLAVTENCREQHKPSYEVEGEIIGVDHAEMGGRLAEKWKLADPLVDAIAGHHDLSKCKDPAMAEVTSLLCTADFICVACGLGVQPNDIATAPEAVWTAAGLSCEDMPVILNAFFETLPSLDELVSAAQ